MTPEQLRELCLSLPGATEQIQWGNDLLFKVAGKMFLCLNLEPPGGYSLKCPEERFYELTELPGVNPAPYLARAHWVQIDPWECRLARSEIEKLVRQSYELVVAKLSRKTQQRLRAPSTGRKAESSVRGVEPRRSAKRKVLDKREASRKR